MNETIDVTKENIDNLKTKDWTFHIVGGGRILSKKIVMEGLEAGATRIYAKLKKKIKLPIESEHPPELEKLKTQLADYIAFFDYKTEVKTDNFFHYFSEKEMIELGNFLKEIRRVI